MSGSKERDKDKLDEWIKGNLNRFACSLVRVSIYVYLNCILKKRLAAAIVNIIMIQYSSLRPSIFVNRGSVSAGRRFFPARRYNVVAVSLPLCL